MWKKLKLLYPKSIQSRILYFFISVFLVILLLMIVPWGIYVQYSTQADNKKIIYQQLEGVDASLMRILDKWNNVIDIMMLNRQFENQVSQTGSKLEKQRALNDTLTRILINDLDLISVVYIDSAGNSYLTSNSPHLYQIHLEMLQSDLWKDRLSNTESGMTYFFNGAGVLEMTKYREPFVSFVRPVNSISDFKPLGIVMMNVTSRHLGEIIGNQVGNSTEVYLYSADGTVVAQTPNARKPQQSLSNYINSGENSKIVNVKGKNSIICWHKSELANLYLLSITPLESSMNLLQNTSVMLLVVTFLTIILIFISQIFITRKIGKPLEVMCRHMRMAEEGEFVPIQIKKQNSQDEITQLQLFFNRMIQAIDALVAGIIEKEKMKRKHEIALLQEQIKPHFLYNALDAVSALILIGDNEKTYTLTQALSSFYRTSLSGGYEVVSLRTELECVENYMIVLNIRYENKITMHYEIEEEIKNESVLKLILQPLVENAIYHGIRPKGEKGDIWIIGKRENEHLVLLVKDNGVGMSPERIQEVLSKCSRDKQNGFGLYSLMEKLNLFYNANDLLHIDSTPGIGTSILLSLPLLPGEAQEKNGRDGK